MKQIHIFTKELAKINAARVALKMRPLKRMPKGVPTEPRGCPVAIALKAVVDQESMDFESQEKDTLVAKAWKTSIINFSGFKEVKTPRVLATFISKFDEREFPELIIKPKVVHNG